MVKQLSHGLLTGAVLIVAEALPTAPANSQTTSNAITEASGRAVEQPQQSSSVELFPPRTLKPSDAEYLVWISGASEVESACIRRWVTELLELDSRWIEELFGPLRASASEQASPEARTRSFPERAESLESLMKQRDAAAASLFARERELLQSMLEQAGVAPTAVESMVESLMRTRIAEALDGIEFLCVHLGPNMLRLLHDAAIDARTNEHARAVIRQLAMDQAPRLLEQRRMVVDACLKSGFRGMAAIARVHATGAPIRGAMAGAMRPVAIEGARTAAMNREVMVLAQGVLPTGPSSDLEQSFLRHTYGPLAVDTYAYDDLEALLLPRIEGAARDQAIALVRAERQRRIDMRDRVLGLFDREYQRSLERGLIRDPERGEQFMTELRRYHDVASRGAMAAIESLKSMARAGPHWDDAEFERALAAWKVSVQQQISDLRSSGITSHIASGDPLAADPRHEARAPVAPDGATRSD